jgi:mono/diheme cytochrome c family protein
LGAAALFREVLMTRIQARTVLAMTLLASPALAQGLSPTATPAPAKREYSGASLFKTYCASCHGSSAKGDGPLAEQLRVRPADLTLLARKNKGQWDAAKVARMIDGREPVKGHGGADMPVWGDAFKSSRDGYDEESVKEKIHALTEYLESLQAAPDKP